MSISNDPCFELLKLLVLARAGRVLTAGSDALLFVLDIIAVTGCPLSETTLLRAYGILPAKFPPSFYTRNVLARYCGYESYAAFCKENAPEGVIEHL